MKNRLEIFYPDRIIRQSKLLQSDKPLHMIHNQYKAQDQFYKYHPPKLHLPDIRQCMFHMQYTLQKFYMP